jgi:hypothetical protein
MSEEEDTKIRMLRQIISSLKKKILETITLTSQDKKKIEEVRKIFKEIYFAVRKVIEKGEPLETLEPFSLDFLFRDLLDQTLTEDDRDTMMYYLRRDLLTYPFTIDTIHINSNLVENEEKE